MGHFREKNSFPKSNHWSRRRSVQYSVYSVVRAGQVLETIALTTAACNLHGQQTTSPFMVLIIVSEARSHFGITASAVLKYLTYEKGSKVEQTCLNFESKTAKSWIFLLGHQCVKSRSSQIICKSRIFIVSRSVVRASCTNIIMDTELLFFFISN